MGVRQAVLLTPSEPALPRSLLSCKQTASLSRFFSNSSSHSQTIEIKATLTLSESALIELPASVGNKALTGSFLLLQTPYNQHLRASFGCVANKGLITPAESALTNISPATPLESALTKMTRVGVPVFKGLPSIAPRSLRESSVGFPSPHWIFLLLFSEPSTFNFRLSTSFSHPGFLTSLPPCFQPAKLRGRKPAGANHV